MRALLSVANRDGIVALARDLLDLDVEVFATDGTREFLAGEGVVVTSVSDLTQGEPDVGGQVKTFHHAVYAGILARRDVPAQLEELRTQGIGLIDMVVVNVKPFAPAIGVKVIGLDEAIEMIDVGGAALLGAAARNAAGVASVADPAHYPVVTSELREFGTVTPETRAKLAAEAFSTVAAYHAEIAAYLNQVSGNTFPRHLALVLEKVDDLRYGENPHQRAAFYRETTHRSGTLADAARIQGEMPSFNNLLDLDAAYRIARDYTSPTVAIVKHTDPVGLASHDELVEAYRHALETDPVAAFGGIVGVNRELDGATAREIAANSYEAVVAPGFSQSAIGILRGKPGLELLAIPPDPTEGMRDYGIASLDFKRVARRPARREPRRARARSGPAPGRDQATTDARGADRPAVRLACGPPRALERDRPGPQRGDGRDRGRPGQPAGLGRDRGPPGGRPGQARGPRLGCLLPVPGRDPGGGRGGRDGHHPAGRLDPRRDGDRGR